MMKNLFTWKPSNTFAEITVDIVDTGSIMKTRIRKAFVHVYFALFAYFKKEKLINLLQLTTCFVQELHEFMYVLSRIVYQIAIVLNYITEVITPYHVVHEAFSSYATFSRDIHSRKPFYFTCHASGTKSFQK